MQSNPLTGLSVVAWLVAGGAVGVLLLPAVGQQQAAGVVSLSIAIVAAGLFWQSQRETRAERREHEANRRLFAVVDAFANGSTSRRRRKNRRRLPV